MRNKLPLLIALVLVPRIAHADARADVESKLKIFVSDSASKRWSSMEQRHEPSECTDAIAAAKKKSVADDAELEFSYDIQKIVKTEKRGEYSGTYRIAFADASKICERYAEVYAYQKARIDVQAGYDTAAWMRDVKPEEASNMAGLSKSPQACLDAIDVLDKQGKATVELDGDKTPTLAEARETCTAALADAQKFESTVVGREQAEHDAVEAVYKKVGIKGKRLELFVYYGMPEGGYFLAKGCKSYVTTAKGLKKAKKLFQWLEADDGTITVRTYSFKGDSYKVSEVQYLTQSSAYRGCK